ncbi:ATP-binding protein [Gloeobacter violaceus]|uniref:Gll1120 protein n=1 Tax=Gloeobacter violaceus (strain ATCC 29082 / PCC 7421) TaxID=251221 RepID=Q7NLK3_GLOVI|nr:ATP-binding protein [Gloeobacter violaceus]BAC89061.1 gll1120 [Gloeobacter violaceus PCC 7421]
MKLTVGNPVKGERFWNREKELNGLIQLLDEKAHVLIIAQRRIGKTSLMEQAAETIKDRYLCLQIDLQSAHSVVDAIAELAAATRNSSLWEKITGIFSNVLNNAARQIDSLQLSELKVTLRTGMTEGSWQAKGDQLFDKLAESDKPVVIFLDEVPILVSRLLKGSDYQMTPERRGQTDAFLSWLRANSLKHREKIRLVVTGSIGLEPILRQVGLSATINHLTPFSIGLWEPTVVKSCVEALAEEYSLTFDGDALEYFVDCLGRCVPYHVQLFFQQVRTVCVREGLTHIPKTLVAEVYEREMLARRGHAELSHLEERLKLVLGPELHPIALEFLTEAAVTGKLSAAAIQVFCLEYKQPVVIAREILLILEHDGYMYQQSNTYRFVSKLVQEWWRAQYSLLFVPASARGK